MAQTDTTPSGPDLAKGVPLASVSAAGVLAGHVDGSPVLLVRMDDGLHAVSGLCTHYGAPLADGLVVDDEIRCPWHHACFSLRTGAALRAPAFAALATWRVEIVGETVFVRTGETAARPSRPRAPHSQPGRIVIIGGGAAGFAAAERLRALGYSGALSMLSADASAPYDRPNLSKDYLAGTAPEDWIPLQGPEFYADRQIDLRLGCDVTAIDTGARQVLTGSGERLAYDVLLIATGAEPRQLPTLGFDLPNVFMLRSLADARAIVEASKSATSVALIGAGFIGMEAAAALRVRGLRVHVVAPEEVPMERALGREVGGFITGLHQEQGVEFHLQSVAKDFDGKVLTLGDGTRVAADLLIVGAGVAPRTELAAAAGLAVQDGILVDPNLQTSVAGHFAAGDVARYRYGADLVRVEHWVHAQRQGQAAAANMLGAGQPFMDVPYFWTHHYGLDLRYTGYAGGWDEIRIDGTLSKQDFTARYFRAGTLVAAASVGRDLENLSIETTLQG
ncbi:3-phenylpropionate/cinnamic acid dioxygenase ferredoxin--NAD(+) reductase component [Pseudomonas fluorescens]|uniref:FAD-dependent oxidoreductase n=1 Tax=Pseudomonas fluorescens TaxID=294 RepID=UPI000F9499F1|nr:FAD-dependent oxidoreductase [Pseudomonas fluorescens]VVM60806.1 3-phenylpropionate/cinnamic acid dioxygenase ferredoxin--NAD(+) reductase component [Pseudomonas fluorescens]VVN90608.1 3-phenylpropionate/cinnamic acid dioxygenase ferredoxin--NAD(+) reductase component [Pseudomonas fluorescens]VVO56170.1 3-phenylpropionate/cinnamic acid dioxygenase ferredoxin--NAD(+) reductase component [Pseudomonas fluorescens]